jgi:hypothetical protein
VSTPATATLNDVTAAIAAQLVDELAPVVYGIQIEPKLVANPTPPCLDVYPGDPFLERSSFGPRGSTEAIFTVRARVVTADQEDGQGLLLELLDPHGPASIWTALEADATLAGTVDDSAVEAVSGFIPYESAGGAGASYTGTLLGAEWRLRVVLR